MAGAAAKARRARYAPSGSKGATRTPKKGGKGANGAKGAKSAPRGSAKAASMRRGAYGVHPGVLMMMDWVETLEEKSGRSLSEWLKLAKGGAPSAATRAAWLKKAHGLGTNMASWIANRVDGIGKDDADPKAYLNSCAGTVEALYADRKALRPLHDRLVKLASSLGREVKLCPCKTMVPVYRHHVIAQIKPTTKTRIDFGLALGDTKASGRLIDTGGFAKKDRITHRITVSSVADIDAELVRWLKIAYLRNAG